MEQIWYQVIDIFSHNYSSADSHIHSILTRVRSQLFAQIQQKSPIVEDVHEIVIRKRECRLSRRRRIKIRINVEVWFD